MDTACVAVVSANGVSGVDLVRNFRFAGAPLAFEITPTAVVPWRVRVDPSEGDRLRPLSLAEIPQAFRVHAAEWSPEALLRAKTIKPAKGLQLDFVDLGLVPALEEQLRRRLEPLLRNSMHAAVTAYKAANGRHPNERQLFQLAFWLLAGKVFRDRQVRGFKSLGPESDTDEILTAVSSHYKTHLPRLLNREARDQVKAGLWGSVDFRNLSVDVLSHIWATTFISPEIRQKLGIHETPRAVAKFIVESLPFETYDLATLRVVEPCCGSATFLLASLHRIRDLMPPTATPQQRHAAFVKSLVGFEKDPFGVEISRLCLTLADFPNPNGWDIREEDVFRSDSFDAAVAQANIVVCNPPFEDFDPDDLNNRPANSKSPRKPVALLENVLRRLDQHGVLGFVLPRAFADGSGYGEVRAKLARRFASLDLLELPERAFGTAQHESVVLLATSPRRSGLYSAVSYSRLAQAQWADFRKTLNHPEPERVEKTSSEARSSLLIPRYAKLWKALLHHPKLGTSRCHRGIEWKKALTRVGQETGNRSKLVVDVGEEGFKRGVPPEATAPQFQVPILKYLSVRPSDQRGTAYQLPWDRPKVLVNAVRRSRGAWRLSAFSDFSGLVCYQNYIAVWPSDPSMVIPLTAVINGPIANLFITAYESKHIRLRTLAQLPIPRLDRAGAEAITSQAAAYAQAVSSMDYGRARLELERLDALVLTAYGLSPDLESTLLGWFAGHCRPVPFDFDEYVPRGFARHLPLSVIACIRHEWPSLNRRRAELIRNSREGDLHESERLELQRLQQYAQARVDLVAPEVHESYEYAARLASEVRQRWEPDE